MFPECSLFKPPPILSHEVFPSLQTWSAPGFKPMNYVDSFKAFKPSCNPNEMSKMLVGLTQNI